MMVLFALVATMVLSAIGAGLVTLTNTEAVIASNYRLSNELGYAAEAGANAAMIDLGRGVDWSSVLSGITRSGFCDTTLTPVSASGARLDLAALTSAWQAASDADAKRGANNPRWRLFLYKPLAAIARTPLATSYVVVWVADDASESDGDPQADSNGLLAIRAEAFGPQGMQRAIDVTLTTDGANMKVVSWRDVR